MFIQIKVLEIIKFCAVEMENIESLEEFIPSKKETVIGGFRFFR